MESSTTVCIPADIHGYHKDHAIALAKEREIVLYNRTWPNCEHEYDLKDGRTYHVVKMW